METVTDGNGLADLLSLAGIMRNNYLQSKLEQWHCAFAISKRISASDA